ncbi:leucine-rich repeat-containing protein 37B-like [Latimeria chalumnae]|uniref:leucine-rich repeat-containing protein 37B-like n=1 Tax=Latimeria chalumnae TaxID=7897 RepID=UPI00313F20B3
MGPRVVLLKQLAALVLVYVLFPAMLCQINTDSYVCPSHCKCSSRALSCHGFNRPDKLQNVPIYKKENVTFIVLDFSGNDISDVGKNNWREYSWTEDLILSYNSLEKLTEDSFDGLFLLKYLDVSYNKIRIIGEYIFESLPFVEIVNLAHNQIAELPKRSFHSWHGLQFLKMLNISHNPLVKISNAAFEEPPSLLLVDFSGTRLSLPAIQNLLMGSPSLQELILPAQMTCCLCRLAKMSSGLLYQLVKLQCEKDCVSNKGSCEISDNLLHIYRTFMKSFELTNDRSRSIKFITNHKESSSKLTSKLKINSFGHYPANLQNYVKQSNNQPKPLVQIPVKVDHIMDFLGGLNESLPEIRPKHNDTNNQTVIIIQSTSKQKLSGKRTKKKNSHTATRVKLSYVQKSEKRGSNFKLGSVKHFILNPLIIKNIEEKAKEGKQSETLGSEKSTKGSMKAPVKRQKMLTQQQKQMENGKIKHEKKEEKQWETIGPKLYVAGKNDLTKLSLLVSLLTIDIEEVLQKIRLIKMFSTKESAFPS